MTSFISEVEAVSKEVKKSSQTTISCVITGLSDATATVSWRTKTGDAVTGENFTPAAGTLSGGTQTSTLLVKGPQVSEDTEYTCTVTSGKYTGSGASDTIVNLDVYGKIKYLILHDWDICFIKNFLDHFLTIL